MIYLYFLPITILYLLLWGLAVYDFQKGDDRFLENWLCGHAVIFVIAGMLLFLAGVYKLIS